MGPNHISAVRYRRWEPLSRSAETRGYSSTLPVTIVFWLECIGRQIGWPNLRVVDDGAQSYRGTATHTIFAIPPDSTSIFSQEDKMEKSTFFAVNGVTVGLAMLIYELDKAGVFPKNRLLRSLLASADIFEKSPGPLLDATSAAVLRNVARMVEQGPDKKRGWEPVIIDGGKSDSTSTKQLDPAEPNEVEET